MYACSSPLSSELKNPFVPAGTAILSILVRTALEDRTLRRELDGYADYARRVRYRLVPGVW